jgi:hypothetical protein
MLITFNFVSFCWIFFRAGTLGESVEIIGSIFSSWHGPFLPAHTMGHGVVALAALLSVEMFREKSGSLRDAVAQFSLPVRWLCWYTLAFLIIALGVDAGGQFIYFQF